jgi:hypothetical protein
LILILGGAQGKAKDFLVAVMVVVGETRAQRERERDGRGEGEKKIQDKPFNLSFCFEQSPPNA